MGLAEGLVEGLVQRHLCAEMLESFYTPYTPNRRPRLALVATYKDTYKDTYKEGSTLGNVCKRG